MKSKLGFIKCLSLLLLPTSLLPVVAYAGGPANCNSGKEFNDYIDKRGCNANLDGQIMWFPSRRSYNIYVTDMKKIYGD